MLYLGALASLACQPIIIGSPNEAGGQGAEAAGGQGASSKPSGGMGGGAIDSNAGGESGTGASPSGAGAGGEPDSGGEGGASVGGSGPCALTVRGRVTIPRGAALVGMDLRLSGDLDATTKTAFDGQYLFERLCPGNYVLTPSCGSSAVKLELSSDDSVNFSNIEGGCDSDLVAPRVLGVIFDPTATVDGVPPRRLSTVLGLGAAPDNFALQLLDELRATTNGHARPNVRLFTGSLAFPPLSAGFRFTPQSFGSCLADAASCSDQAIDYQAVDLELGLCDLVRSENIDQIWVYGADQFNLPRVGNLSCQLQVDGSTTTQVIDVIGMRYNRGVSGVFADFQAAADAELMSVFPNTPGDLVTNPYVLFKEACGAVGKPPNTAEAGHFGQTATVSSFCDAFLDYPPAPPLPVKPLGCADWGCTELGFSRFWFAHLPRARWFDEQARYRDFWRSVLTNRHLATQAVAVTCSSSYERGLCEHVNDGQHGSCNVGEWATQQAARGWVEYQFAPPRSVSGLQLYDRACDENVLAGHVEFSDGSAPLSFGALEPSGNDSTDFLFPPKLLSGLRVYIDESSGENPGLGEVSVTFEP